MRINIIGNKNDSYLYVSTNRERPCVVLTLNYVVILVNN